MRNGFVVSIGPKLTCWRRHPGRPEKKSVPIANHGKGSAGLCAIGGVGEVMSDLLQDAFGILKEFNHSAQY